MDAATDHRTGRLRMRAACIPFDALRCYAGAAMQSAVSVRELPRGADWLRIVGGLRRRPGFWWLDSALVDARLGRFSFAGAEPWCVLRCHGARSLREVRRAGRPDAPLGRSAAFGDPLDALRALLPAPPAEEAKQPVPFAGGALVALGYELGAALEPVAVAAGDDLALPDLTAFGVDRLYAFDHVEGRGFALAWAEDADARAARHRAEESARALVSALPDGEPPPAPVPARGAPHVERGFDRESHGKTVERIREGIGAGDLYQACLTHRLELPFDGDAWVLAGALRTRNPAPFACLLELPGVTVVGSSPERFLHVAEGGWLESRPIKGTRPRGADRAADRDARAALAASAKDRAENLMIVDLVRNDLGRVCEIGSIHVPELFAIEPYATVFQLVSTVRGRLAPGRSALDAVRAAFPPGSMTGAPKLAAMELLARLEPVRRGLYSGAIGYLDLRGGADLAVTIRTALLRGGRAYVHTGGGIVADSEPAAEWAEAEDKARALLTALAEASAPGRYA
jgi:aminodeoxychorismate synthase component I